MQRSSCLYLNSLGRSKSSITREAPPFSKSSQASDKSRISGENRRLLLISNLVVNILDYKQFLEITDMQIVLISV